MLDYNKRIYILAGVRRVHDLGPRGGERRRFQVWIERRDERLWQASTVEDQRTSGYRLSYYGETFNRQWEAAQAARHASEQCRALESVFRAFEVQ